MRILFSGFLPHDNSGVGLRAVSPLMNQQIGQTGSTVSRIAASSIVIIEIEMLELVVQTRWQSNSSTIPLNINESKLTTDDSQLSRASVRARHLERIRKFKGPRQAPDRIQNRHYCR